jgi:uncharacterized membrane protein
MKSKENFEPIVVTKGLVKTVLYLIFLVTVGIYFIFFNRDLKPLHKEKCPCDSKYTLYEYRDNGKLLENNRYDLNTYETFKLKNNLGFTIDKLVHVNLIKMNDTVSINSKQKGVRPFGMQFYWDCKNKEVWVSIKHKLSFK